MSRGRKAYMEGRPMICMERSERTRLESIRRRMKQDLATVDALLRKAHPPHRLSRANVRSRVQAICREVQAHGSTVEPDRLRAITAKHKMPFSSVGALFSAGYLRKSANGISLGKRGLAAVVGAKRKGRRSSRK